MAGATLSTLSNILKDFYLPPVVEQLNNEVLMLQRLEARDQELFGNVAVVPVHKDRSGGVGAVPEDGALPSAGNQGYAKATFDLKYLYGRIRVTGPAMAKTASEAGAFLQALKGEMDGIRNDLKKDLARQVYADGTGQIAQCGTTSASTTVVLSSAEALRKGHIHIGMVIDIGTAGDADSISGAGTPRTVTDYNLTTPSITISGAAVTTSSSHFISRAGSRSATDGSSYEIDGLLKMVSTAANTVGNINGASAGNGYWQNIVDSTGGSPTLDLFAQVFNRVRIAGGDTSIAVTTFGIQRGVFGQLSSNVRYVNTTDLKGGYTGIEVHGRPLVADVDAPFGKVFVLDEKFLKVFSPRDWHFLDEDGNVLKWVVGYDAWEAVLARYLNLGISRRNVQALITGLTDTTGY